MNEDRSEDILKGALLLEYRGKALYESVTKNSKVKEVIDLFSMLREEEEKHIDFLKTQFSRLSKGEEFDVSGLDKDHDQTVKGVLSEAIVGQISGAGYEAAVISAALELEKKAVTYYTQQADSAASMEEEKVYRWLAKWEKTHMRMLAELDKELKEKIWYDNQFWPLD
jgi:rubrerythrin